MKKSIIYFIQNHIIGFAAGILVCYIFNIIKDIVLSIAILINK